MVDVVTGEGVSAGQAGCEGVMGSISNESTERESATCEDSAELPSDQAKHYGCPRVPTDAYAPSDGTETEQGRSSAAWFAVVAALLAGLALLLTPQPVQGHAAPVPCVWIAEIDRTLVELGEPGDAWEAADSAAERVADCGSRLLGSQFTPYLDPVEEWVGARSAPGALDTR